MEPTQQKDASTAAVLRALQGLALPQEQMAKFQASWDSWAKHTTDTKGVVHELWLLAFRAGSRGDKVEQLTWERAALTVAQAAGLADSTALACQRVAIAYLHLSRPEDAARQYEQCVQIAAGTPYEATTYQGLAGAYEQVGRYDEARKHYEQAMRLVESGERGKLFAPVIGGWASGLSQKFAKKGRVWNANVLYKRILLFYERTGQGGSPYAQSVREAIERLRPAIIRWWLRLSGWLVLIGVGLFGLMWIFRRKTSGSRGPRK